MQKQSITESFLLQNFVITYQGNSTAQITEAFANLKKASFDHYGHFLKLCQLILQKQSFSDRNISLSIVNFIQKLTETFIQERILNPMGPKVFYTSLQHLLDNQKINPKLKQQLAYSYIKMANYFSQNFQRIIGKIKYYYETNKYMEALAISRAYIQQPTFKNKAKHYFYKSSFVILLQKTCQCILQFIGQTQNNRQNILWILQQFLSTLYKCLKNVIFQKFQSVLLPIFEKQEINFIFKNIREFMNYSKITILLHKIMSEIVSNFGRIKIFQRYPVFFLTLRKYLQQELEYFTRKIKDKKCCFQNNEMQSDQIKTQQRVMLKLFNYCFQYNIIEWTPNQNEVFQCFLIPLHQVSINILFSEEDSSQKLNLLEDSIYYMKSQCVQVLFLKLIKTIILKKQDVLNKTISLVNQILFNSKQNNSLSIQSSKVDQIRIYLLNFIIYQVHILMRNQNFLQNLQNFMIVNIPQFEFGKHSNSLIYYLLIYKHYMDQLFFREDSISISTSLLKSYLNERSKCITNKKDLSNNQIFTLEIFKQILIDHFKIGFEQKSINNEIILLAQFFIDHFDLLSLPILNQVILNYQFEDKLILSILDTAFSAMDIQIQKWKQTNNQLNKKMQVQNQTIKGGFQLIQSFFKVEHWKQLFQYILSKTVSYLKFVNKQYYIDNLIQIAKNSINYLKYIPKGFTQVVIDLFDLRSIKSFHSFQTLTVILKYSKKQQSNFVCISQSKYQNQILINSLLNKLISIIKKCTFSDYSMDTLIAKLSLVGKLTKPPKYYKRQIPALLLIHQIIYYHSYAITENTIKLIIQTTKQILQQKINQFNHVNGKYLLNFLFLLKYRFNTTMSIFQNLNITSWVFQQVYKKQNQYRVQYDIPLLVYLELYIRKTHLRDHWIMKYLNISFLCIFYNVNRVYILKKNPITLESDSDEELQPEQPYILQLKDIWKIIQKMELPDQFKTIQVIDAFSKYVQQLLKNQRTKEWVKIMVQKGLKNSQKKHFDEIIKLENIDGKLRSIRIIKKQQLEVYRQ